jgi:hypothetical protein
MASTDKIQTLQAELAALKKERNEQAIVAKKEKKWVSVKKRLPKRGPMSGSIHVLAWANEKLELCWFDDEKVEWHRYNGTWCVRPKDRVENVTHWIGTDWMTSKYCPPYGPGIKNFLIYHWYRMTDRASDMAYDLRPKGWSKTAQLGNKPVFYKDSSGKLMTGLPENIPSPRGYEKIVCNSANEAERYSSLQRQQERYEHGKQQAERGAIEAEFQHEWRSDAHHLMANARNNKNREFMRRALERNESHSDPTKYERESYLHSEAFEDKH